MKTHECAACGAVNELAFSVRPGTTDHVTIRCKNCKKLLKVAITPAS